MDESGQGAGSTQPLPRGSTDPPENLALRRLRPRDPGSAVPARAELTLVDFRAAWAHPILLLRRGRLECLFHHVLLRRAQDCLPQIRPSLGRPDLCAPARPVLALDGREGRGRGGPEGLPARLLPAGRPGGAGDGGGRRLARAPRARPERSGRGGVRRLRGGARLEAASA